MGVMSELKRMLGLRGDGDVARRTLGAIDRGFARIEFAPDGQILDANEAFLHAVGYAREEVVGRHHRMFVEAAYADSTQYRQFWEKLGRGEFDRGQYRRLGKGGREVWIEASYCPVLDARGRVLKVVKIAADVTASRQQTADYQGQGEWAPTPTVTAYVAGDQRYVVVTANEGSGCGDFLGQLAAVFAWEGGQARLASNPDAGFLRIDALVDSDGDGKPELIGAEADFSTVIGHLTPSGAGFATRSSVTFPFNDCGC